MDFVDVINHFPLREPMEPVRLFKAGESIKGMREKLNSLVREMLRLRNIQGDGIQVSHTANGVLISVPKQTLLIDDKYRLDSDENKSRIVHRRGDLKSGDLGDSWRVRAHPTGVEREVGERKELPAYRVMWLINKTPAGEGGWITDAATIGLDKTGAYPPHEVPTPISAIGQIGDIVILTADDEISKNSDGDIYTLANIRHDAHFHYNEAHDGRIYFTTTPPGVRPTGPTIIGEMVGDPAKANTDTALGRETVNWCPQICKTFPPDTLIYPNPSEDACAWPTFRRISGSAKMGAVFPDAAPTTGWSGDTQLPNVYGATWNLGYVVEYSAVNATGADKAAIFGITGRVVGAGEDMTTGGTAFAEAITVAIPDGSTERILRYDDFPVVAGANLSDGDMVIIDKFFRDYDAMKDTLDAEVLVVGFKALFTEDAVL